LIVELLFDALHLIPSVRNAKVIEAGITLNYTTVLNIIFLIIASVLVVRFLRTGGPAMLRMMGNPPPAAAGGDQEHACPMHPDVRQHGPGRCPKCGMALVPTGDETTAHHHH
jgi:uncharacterized protein